MQFRSNRLPQTPFGLGRISPSGSAGGQARWRQWARLSRQLAGPTPERVKGLVRLLSIMRRAPFAMAVLSFALADQEETTPLARGTLGLHTREGRGHS